MKPGKFTHAIAVLLSSVSACFAPSVVAQAPTKKTQLNKKHSRLNEDVLFKVDPVGYTPPSFALNAKKGRRPFPLEETDCDHGFLDWRKANRE